MRSSALLLILAAAGCGLNSGGQPPRHAVDLNNQAYRAYQRGQLEQALRLVNDAIEADSRFVQAYANKAAILEDKGKTDEAIDALNILMELAPENPDAHVSLGVLLEKAGRDSEAPPHYERALNLFEAQAQTANARDKIDIDVKIAVAKYLSGDAPAAVTALDRVLNARPEMEYAAALRERIETGCRDIFLHGLDN